MSHHSRHSLHSHSTAATTATDTSAIDVVCGAAVAVTRGRTVHTRRSSRIAFSSSSANRSATAPSLYCVRQQQHFKDDFNANHAAVTLLTIRSAHHRVLCHCLSSVVMAVMKQPKNTVPFTEYIKVSHSLPRPLISSHAVASAPQTLTARPSTLLLHRSPSVTSARCTAATSPSCTCHTRPSRC